MSECDSLPTFDQFIEWNWRNAWLYEPGIRLYMRRSIPYRQTDFDLASASADEPGSGALTRFLDKYDSKFRFYLENVIQDRLVPYYIKRGYEIIEGSDPHSPCMRKPLK